MLRDNVEFKNQCDKCKRFSNFIHAHAEIFHSIISLTPSTYQEVIYWCFSLGYGPTQISTCQNGLFHQVDKGRKSEKKYNGEGMTIL